jgi:hypothetical protein
MGSNGQGFTGFRREIEWRMTKATYQRLNELLDELELYSEGSDPHEATLDEIRSTG